MKKIILLLTVVIILGGGYYYYGKYKEAQRSGNEHLVSGNGRIEATEVNIATKLAGRIEDILVNEGDFVKQGQTMAVMQTSVLRAELAQAQARRNQAVTAEASAKAMIDVRASEKEAAKAVVLQRQSTRDGARKSFNRSKALRQVDATSEQQFEDFETALNAAEAQLIAAEASVKQADAVIESAKAEAIGATASIQGADADIARIEADITDSTLLAPRDGRIQYRIAQPGEVMSAGGRVLNLVDLSDVYMTFFLAEEIAGKVSIGADVRIVLDALPAYPIPAKVSYVASVAQFTPKTVETQSERQKLMFRVKARIAPELLREYLELVKTGVPGIAWVKLDPKMEWPEFLALKGKK
jgi:HlyD family secretion protein